MKLTRSFSTLTALLATATLGLAACSTEPTTSVRPVQEEAAIALELSSSNAAVGSRIAVAVNVDAPRTKVAGIQGVLRFDAARLQYVGQSATGATAVVGKGADLGELRFTSFDLDGLQGRAALLVFQVKGAGYASTISYEHQKASTNDNGLRSVSTTVRPMVVERTLSVPADARAFRFEDWKSTLVAAGKDRAVALKPGDLQQVNLQFGDINYDAAIGLDDYLGIAFAAVGLDEIIVGTDGPSRDVDLVIAGNVFPNNGTVGSPACGTAVDGSRVLDLDDYLGIAFYAVGLATEPCIGQVIPGRGAAPTLREIPDSATTNVNSGETLTLTNDRVWQLNRSLRVRSGGNLIIQAGTRIEANSDSNPVAVFVERGGQINANGTQYRPIVFTCNNTANTATDASKASGCWSGVWISGKARINLAQSPNGVSPDGCAQRDGEAGFGMTFGGCDDADNSGSLSYAVIEFAGYIVSANKELNCLTLAAVGSATQIHHIQCHAGLDDGVEFFGGNVSTHHLLITAVQDDGFDVSFGLRGEHQFVIIQEDVGDAAGDTKGIEADGNEPAPGTVDLPRTAPKLFNFSIFGERTTTNQAGGAIQLRRATGVKIYNSVVAGWTFGLDMDDALTCDTFGSGVPVIQATTFIEVANLAASDGSDPVCGAGLTTEQLFLESQTGHQVIAGARGSQIATYFNDAYNISLPDWRMRQVGGQPILGNTVTPASAGATSFVVPTNYRGAVESGLGGSIPWYSGWTRGFRSAATP